MNQHDFSSEAEIRAILGCELEQQTGTVLQAPS